MPTHISIHNPIEFIAAISLWTLHGVDTVHVGIGHEGPLGPFMRFPMAPNEARVHLKSLALKGLRLLHESTKQLKKLVSY